jgi:hypothetical protein
MAEKLFLLPPLKGLNMYDNPFTMPPDYAVEMVNYMPPTTNLKKRPATENVLTISDGSLRGVMAYQVGASYDYGQNWYNSTIEYGATYVMMLKISRSDGNTYLVSVDPKTKTVNNVGTISNSSYNDDSVLYRHTLFFTSGEASSSMYLFHESKGFAKFALSIGTDGNTQVGNMQNITCYNDYLFMSGQSSLNIFFIQAHYADILDPLNSGFWYEVSSIFSPAYGSSFTLDGLVTEGGQIIKLTTLSKSGADTMSVYLCAITDLGEVILFDGTDPTDQTGEKWKCVGRFKVSPPLNRNAFCEMEGDIVIVTKNGLISLRRVIFNQRTDITENLEYRLMSLFDSYQFKSPMFSDFIGLFYHPRNRMLIFNIPTDLPIPLNKIPISYTLGKNKTLVFNQDFSAEFVNAMDGWVSSYIYNNYINYSVQIQFNDEQDEGIFFSANTVVTNNNNVYSGTTTIDFYIVENGQKTSFFQNPVTYTVSDLTADNINPQRQNDFVWNGNLINVTLGKIQYSYQIKSDDITVTNIDVNTDVFFVNQNVKTTLYTIGMDRAKNLQTYKLCTKDDKYWLNKFDGVEKMRPLTLNDIVTNHTYNNDFAVKTIHNQSEIKNQYIGFDASLARTSHMMAMILSVVNDKDLFVVRGTGTWYAYMLMDLALVDAAGRTWYQTTYHDTFKVEQNIYDHDGLMELSHVISLSEGTTYNSQVDYHVEIKFLNDTADKSSTFLIYDPISVESAPNHNIIGLNSIKDTRLKITNIVVSGDDYVRYLYNPDRPYRALIGIGDIGGGEYSITQGMAWYLGGNYTLYDVNPHVPTPSPEPTPNIISAYNQKNIGTGTNTQVPPYKNIDSFSEAEQYNYFGTELKYETVYDTLCGMCNDYYHAMKNSGGKLSFDEMKEILNPNAQGKDGLGNMFYDALDVVKNMFKWDDNEEEFIYNNSIQFSYGQMGTNAYQCIHFKKDNDDKPTPVRFDLGVNMNHNATSRVVSFAGDNTTQRYGWTISGYVLYGDGEQVVHCDNIEQQVSRLWQVQETFDYLAPQSFHCWESKGSYAKDDGVFSTAMFEHGWREYYNGGDDTGTALKYGGWMTCMGTIFGADYPYKRQVKIGENSVGANADETQTYINNFDLSAIPIFSLCNVVCDYGSTQYVFDSHFGTWSSFTGVNMMRGVEFQNDFYYFTPSSIKYTDNGYVTSGVHVMRLNENNLGDYNEHTGNNDIAIQTSFKTPMSFDLGNPNKKMFKRLKIFGTPSTFWQSSTSSDKVYPLVVTPYVDFKTGQPVSFVHTFDHAVSKKVLAKHFVGAKSYHELSKLEQKKFWKLYMSENDMIAQIDLPLIAHVGSRFGVKIDNAIKEAYVNVYGIEVVFDMVQGGLSE